MSRRTRMLTMVAAVCLGNILTIVDPDLCGDRRRTIELYGNNNAAGGRLPRHLTRRRAPLLSVRGMGIQVGCAVLRTSYRLIQKEVVICSRVRFSSIKPLS